MIRLIIRVSEHELREIQRLARLREVTVAQLGYQAFARFMEIELRNPRPAPDAPEELKSAAIPKSGPHYNLTMKKGIADPLEIIRNSVDPVYSARVQALAALSSVDDECIFLPLASSLLTGLFLCFVFDRGGRTSDVRAVYDIMGMPPEDFKAALDRISSDAEPKAAAILKSFTSRPLQERDGARHFAQRSIKVFFEPVLAASTGSVVQAKQYDQVLIILVSYEEHAAFVKIAYNLRTSPAYLGRQVIQRLVGQQNRPHLALVPGGHGKD